MGARAHCSRARAETKATRRIHMLQYEQEMELLDEEALIINSAVDAIPASPVKLKCARR